MQQITTARATKCACHVTAAQDITRVIALLEIRSALMDGVGSIAILLTAQVKL